MEQFIAITIVAMIAGIVLFIIAEFLHGRLKWWMQTIASAVMMYCSCVLLLLIFGSLHK